MCTQPWPRRERGKQPSRSELTESLALALNLESDARNVREFPKNIPDLSHYPHCLKQNLGETNELSCKCVLFLPTSSWMGTCVFELFSCRELSLCT